MPKLNPKVIINRTVGRYSFKTVTEPSEYSAALKLRYDVFQVEMLQNPVPGGLDFDEFDSLCDHLIILENQTGLVVGTYRLNCSTYSDKFYSDTEFNIKPILDLPGHKLEIGRAAIHKDHRKGAVILMLWRGIACYMSATDSKFLFGCASFKTESARISEKLYQYFKSENYLDVSVIIEAKDEFKFSAFQTENEKVADLAEVQSFIPALVQSYLNFGSKIASSPAHDKIFKCVDFITLMRLENIDQTLWEKLIK